MERIELPSCNTCTVFSIPAIPGRSYLRHPIPATGYKQYFRLQVGNIAYNLLQELGGADTIGPVLLGLKKPVHVLQLGSSIRSIFNMVPIAVVDAQMKCEADTKEAINNSKWWKQFKRTSHEL